MRLLASKIFPQAQSGLDVSSTLTCLSQMVSVVIKYFKRNSSRHCVCIVILRAISSLVTAFILVLLQLLQQKRLIDRSYPGSYILNPHVLRSVRKLERLIDIHMERIGAQRISMPSLSPANLWKKTG